MPVQEYGLRWREFNRSNQLVLKEKFFRTKKARDYYTKTLEKRNNFHSIYAYVG